MKTHLTGALVAAAAVLLLAGCGNPVPTQPLVAATTDATSPDDLFLAIVEAAGVDTTGAEDEMIALGYSSCDLTDQIGDPSLAVDVALQQAGGDAISEDIVAAVFQGAVGAYCPEHAAGVGRALADR